MTICASRYPLPATEGVLGGVGWEVVAWYMCVCYLEPFDVCFFCVSAV